MEIPNVGKHGELFCFLDGLEGWAKMGLKRCGVQDLAFAIATAESLIEFKKESFKGQSKKTSGSGKGRGDRDKPPSRDKPFAPKDNGNEKKNEVTKEALMLLM